MRKKHSSQRATLAMMLKVIAQSRALDRIYGIEIKIDGVVVSMPGKLSLPEPSNDNEWDAL